ncbi:AmmeMemoRadiSam system radical SAM enzyme [Trichlorobacter ammonificans]|uniref:Pyruvate formate lyase activating enzyme n=1 Tax=Trichlorobacter ammonificans TaxID=2916410 RepID=A0ABM9D7F6_9BACT|nr:AmmeMemoRadiSam system radical SAM enzyme [Trichlorobacter ammonificans]CAH2031160.1 Pyruvate formate lyase activating enzyme [Trichlorobacter ammonificans]
MKRATLFQPAAGTAAQCLVCRHRCTIATGKRGLCRVRENRDAALWSLVYGLLVAQGSDPMEKKPLYHVLPGSHTWSVASVGCNFRCLHCQNAEIAAYDDTGSGRFPGQPVPPEETLRQALAHGCRSISYTYTEPTVWLEYALDTARLAVEAGLWNFFVTNGYITSQALDLLAPVLHGANIDLKGFTEEFYRRVCGAKLSETLDGIRDYRRRGIWLEITTLVIPGENDDDEQLNGIARFIAEELGPDTPWHVSRFFPRHRMLNHPPTPESSLERALEAGDRAGLRYLYVGNVNGGREHTRCPSCGATVIGRSGYRITSLNLRDGSCGRCGAAIPGLWG